IHSSDSSLTTDRLRSENKKDRSEQNHTASFAFSIGTPIRPNGIPDSKAFACSVDSWLQLSTAAVLVIPGQIELIRIFFLPNSKAALLVKPLTPCLAEI